MSKRDNEGQIITNGGLRKSIRTLLVEVFSIVIGALLALAVDQWNEQRNNRRNADEALINIKKELGTNINLLELIHKNNTTVYQNLVAEKSSDTDNGGIVPGLQLQDTARRTL